MKKAGEKILNKKITRFIAMFLVWSIVVTSQAFVTLAEGIENYNADTTVESIIGNSNETTVESYYETNTETSPNANKESSEEQSTTEKVDEIKNEENIAIEEPTTDTEKTELSPDSYESEVKNKDYVEEPEEDSTGTNNNNADENSTTTTIESSNLTSGDIVWADTIRPYTTDINNENPNSDNLTSDSNNADENSTTTTIESSNLTSGDTVRADTIRPYTTGSTATTSEIDIDEENIGNVENEEQISTKSDIDFEEGIQNNQVATDSEMDTENLIDIATDSEIDKENQIDIATNSEINDKLDTEIATISEINKATNSEIEILIATDSEIDMATLSEIPIFGASPVESHIWFGVYPQNDTTGQQLEPIKWRILTQNSNEALLLTESIIDGVQFHSSTGGSANRWESCELRTWLNNSFVSKAFTPNQKNTGIITKRIETKTGMSNVQVTNDKLFNLSLNEIKRIYPAYNSRIGTPSEYAKSRNVRFLSPRQYWLRDGLIVSPTWKDPYWVYLVKSDGRVQGEVKDSEGNDDDVATYPTQGSGLRPAMYVDLTSEMFKTSNNLVTWDKNDGWSFKDASILWDSYDKYQGCQKLPLSNNITLPTGKKLLGWLINDELDGNLNPYTEIPIDQTGDIKLTPVFDNEKYNIAWTLNGGEWDGDEGETEYTYSKGYKLPTNIKPPAGRVFDHWEIDGNPATSINRTDTGDKTVVAVYKNIDYNITWVANGATLNDGSTFEATYPTYTYGTGLTLPTSTDITMLTGKTFDHFTVDGITATNISTTTYGDVIVTLIDLDQSTKTHTISFDKKTGTDEEWDFPTGYPAPTTYTEGVPIPLPTNIVPNNPGFEFDHWEVDGQPTNEIPGNKNTDDLPVKPIFKHKTFNITYELGTGIWDGQEGQNTYEYSVGYQLPTNVKSQDNTKEFDHWEIGGTTTTEISTTDTGDKTVVAKYKNATYNITWVVNGATLASGDDFQTTYPTYTYSTAFTLPTSTNITMPTGETFDYWTINGIKGTSISNTNVGDVTITLITTTQSSNTHTIAWDFKTGTDEEWGFPTGYPTPTEYVEGVPVPLPKGENVEPKNPGLEFDHWEVDGEPKDEIPTGKNNDVNIKPVFKSKTFNITYNLGQGAWNGTAGANTYTYGTAYTIPTNIIPPVGKTFSHWTMGSATITGITATDTGDKVISAKYTNNTYNITWVLNNATVNGTFDTYTYGSTIDLPTTTDITEETGKTFDYWLINGIEGTKITNTTHGDLTITLIYQGASKSPIVKELHGGEEMPGFTIPSEYVEGTEVILPTVNDMIAPVDMELDYFLVNGVRALNIPSNATGEVKVEAIYKEEPLTPTPTPTPTPSPTPYIPGGGGGRGGSGGNGGGGGSSNLPTYDANGNLVPGGLNGFDASNGYMNVRDDSGHSGFGRWLRIPNTTTWYFEVGAQGSIPNDKVIKSQIINTTLLQYQSNGMVTGQYDYTNQINQQNKTNYPPTTNLLINGWYNLGWKGKDCWYHFDKDGVMQMGWFTENNKIYYLETDISSNWYGRMVTGEWTINGQKYKFDNSGALIQ